MNATAAATPSAPWYRHRWPWLLMAGPAIVVAAGFATLWLAVRSDDGLVADDYYKQGLAINRTLARADRAAELGIVADIEFGPDGAVAARLEGRGPSATPPQVRLTLARPAQAGGDVPTVLVRQPDGRYAGRVPPLASGRWQLLLETEEWRLPALDVTVPLTRATLRPDPRRS